ncbi:MAG: hypothetical protein JWO69_1232 [Thermoleophilia bacterium]|jgi:hypothetical protein|nr:hypothetical protein [Thermoleophilia bacterium]
MTQVEQLREIVETAAARATRRPSAGQRTFRPRLGSATNLRRRGVAGLVVVLVLLGIQVESIRRDGTDGLMVGIVTVGSVLLILLVMALLARRSRVVAGPTEFVHRGLFRTRRIATDELGVMVTLTLTSFGFGGISNFARDTFLFTKEGKFVARLRDGVWRESQMDDIAAALGVERVDSGSEVPATLVPRAWPESGGRFDRHPWRWSFVIAFGILLLVAAVVLLTDGFDATSDEPPSAEFQAQRSDEQRMRAELDEVAAETFPQNADDGSLTGCITERDGAVDASACRVHPDIRELVERIAPDDVEEAVQVLCRCVPSEFGFVAISGYEDPAPEATEVPVFELTSTSPVLLTGVRITGEGATYQLLATMPLVGEGPDRMIDDITCASPEEAEPGAMTRAPVGAGLRELAGLRGAKAPSSAEDVRCEPAA